MTIRATALLKHVVQSVSDDGVSDRELLRSFVQRRDQTAFAAIVQRHGALVYGVCRRALSHPQDAEDACQATFLILSRKAHVLRWQESVANWLYTTARKVARNALVAAQRRRRQERRAAVSEAVSPADVMTGRELLGILDEELEKLPPRYREPLVLCCLEGLTRDEAAARLGVPAGTLKIRLERGRKRLSDSLAIRGCTFGAGLLAVAATSPAGAAPARLSEAILSAAAGQPPAAVAALAKGVAATGLGKWAWAAIVLVAAAGISFGLSRGAPPAVVPPSDPVQHVKAEAPQPATPNKPDEARTITGRVIGPDGGPVKGAVIRDVAFSRADTSADDRGIGTVLAESDGDGRFSATLSAGSSDKRIAIIATAPSVGLGWIQKSFGDRRFPDGELTLRLVPDQVVAGRVIDTQGKPVAGAIIGVKDVIAPLNDDMDRLAASVKKGGFGLVGQWEKTLVVPPGIGVGPVTTDKDGRFELRGLGADRVIGLAVSGKGIARTSGFVFNRVGLDVQALNAGWAGRMSAQDKGRHPVIYGPALTFVVEPGFAVRGTVRDADSGAPVPNCRLQINTGFWDWVATRTDAGGKYRIEGLARGMYHSLWTNLPPVTDLMDRFLSFDDPRGFETVDLDVKLARGAVFTGRVVDRHTGQGVRASFQIIPKGDNPNLARPEYESAARDMVWKSTDADGRFRIVTVPGKLEIRVSTSGCQTLYGQMFSPYRPHDPFTVTLAAGKNDDTVVELDRGQTAARSVVDAAGKPVTGLVTAGMAVSRDLFQQELTVVKLPQTVSDVTVYGMGPNEVRDLLLVQPERKLARLARVKAGTNDSVKLFPLQPVNGRLTDLDGNPLAGLTVAVDYNDFSVRQVVDGHTTFTGTATTDADGRFTIPDVIPGLSFSLEIRKGATRYVGAPRIGSKWMLPGFPLNLGDRKVEPAR